MAPKKRPGGGALVHRRSIARDMSQQDNGAHVENEVMLHGPGR